jgi:hypothetical protein
MVVDTKRTRTVDLAITASPRDRRLTLADGAVVLRRGVTLADERGSTTSRDIETITNRIRAKKEFDLDSATARAAGLCIHVETAKQPVTLLVEVNGERLEHPLGADRDIWNAPLDFNTDRWTYVPLPIGALRVGINTFVVYTGPGQSASLFVEPSSAPNRSAKSVDGGQTWDDDVLGINDSTDGEYLIRLYLDRYSASGRLETDAIDLWGESSPGCVPIERPEATIRLGATAETSDATAIGYEGRWGNTPAYDPERWAAWRPIAPGETVAVSVRYAQVRATLSTRDPARTPRLQEICLHLDPANDGDRSLGCWQILSADQPRPARSSYKFGYLPLNTSRLSLARERWELDKIAAGAGGDLELFDRLAIFTRHSWEDGWSSGQLDYCPPWDALAIRELARLGLSLGMCTHYATVFVTACLALGIPARHIILRDHCVADAWSDEWNKWVCVDAGGDADDLTKYTYRFERGGLPLSSLEAHRAWLDQAFDEVELVPAPQGRAVEKFTAASRLQYWDHVFTTLREDDLHALTPGEPEHGYTNRAYQFDGYLWWQDDQTPPQPWFSRYTERDADFDWDLNWTVMHLRSLGDDRLGVQLETLTPGLERFAVRIDDGEWQPRPAEFELSLPSGRHRLAARSINRLGRLGRVAWLEVSSSTDP